MNELMISTLVSYYRVSAESAEELITELRDLTSLKILACGYRVPSEPPQSEFHG
jgi:hypothetical protein